MPCDVKNLTFVELSENVGIAQEIYRCCTPNAEMRFCLGGIGKGPSFLV